jgi:hypothetical protein
MKIEDDILIERFLQGDLTKEEKASFLDRLRTDSQFKEYVNLEKQLSEALNENSWNFAKDASSHEIQKYETILKSEETYKIKQAIKKAQEDYNKSQKPSKNWFLYVAAAVILVLFSTLIFDTKSATNDELFASYLQDTDLLSLVDRGAYDSIFNAVQTSFNNQKYDEVVNSLSQVVDSVQNGNAYIYLAISQIELEKYSNAENTLDKLIASDLIDSQKGYWYRSLLYLKSNQSEKTKKELQLIIDSSFYKSKEAKQLLKELK